MHPPDFYATVKDYGPIVVVPVLFLVGALIRELFDRLEGKQQSHG